MYGKGPADATTCMYACIHTYIHIHTHTHTHYRQKSDNCHTLKLFNHQNFSAFTIFIKCYLARYRTEVNFACVVLD